MDRIHPPARAAPGERLTVVVPVFNEADGLDVFHQRLGAVLDGLDGLAGEVLYVDDGSSDGSAAVLARIADADPRAGFLRLSRNFGKEIAMSAGIDRADADAVVLIDADLQDPPELIPRLVEQWREGFDVVYAKRHARRGESWLKRVTAAAFYRGMRRISEVQIPTDTGDFRLLSRRAVAALRRLRERHRFMKGLYAWIGYAQVAVPYDREPRAAGRSKFTYWRLWNFALEGITSFSTVPLRLFSYLGLLVAGAAFLFGLWIIAKTLLWGDAVPGYPSLMVVILFLGGMQLLAIGVLGEYLGRLFDEAKQRPLYFVAEECLPGADAVSRVEDESSSAAERGLGRLTGRA